MNIPLLDLKRQYQSIKPEIDAAIKRVVESGRFILGPEVTAFEQEVAEKYGVKNAIGVASGTDSLLLSLQALGIGPGDKVIVPSFTFFATAGVVHNVGAIPVFADIDPDTYNLAPAAVRRILESSPTNPTNSMNPTNSINSSLVTDVKAIIPVHLYGQMADMDEIMQIAEEYGLYVLEDAAQAIGATYKATRPSELRTTHSELGPNEPHELNELHEPYEPNKPNKPRTTNHELPRKAGSIGHLGCFSFFPTKNLGAYGDGGMVITNDDALAEKLRILRVHGSKPKYYHHIVGTNSRLDSIQAAVLRAKLPHLDDWSKARNNIAMRYDKMLSNVPGISVTRRKQDRAHIFHQYTIRVENGRRDALQEYLKEQGVGTMIYYPLPLHLQECFHDLSYKEGDLPQSEQASNEVLSLPVFPELTQEEQDYVVDQIRRFAD